LNNYNNNSSIKTKLSLRGEKCKPYAFKMNAVSMLMTGRMMASVKYDSKKQFKLKNNK
jgi:hypothetical protein